MVLRLDRLADIAAKYAAIVLDQWGVLHDGSAPYPAAPACLAALKSAGVRLAVLSNSGKRAPRTRPGSRRWVFRPICSTRS